MRERRAWPSPDRDADSTESAAFEQTVAVVKETVVRSGEVLVSAKEDLSDHQRWLQAQSAAVEADRARHERWLQRQREHREAVARKERARRRRQLVGQRIIRSINQAIVNAIRFVRSLILLAVAKTIAGIAWVGARLRDFALYIAASVMRAVRWTASKIRDLLLALGHSIAAGFSLLLAKTGSLLGVSGQAMAAGASRLSAGTRAHAASTGRGIAAGISRLAAGIVSLARPAGALFASILGGAGAKLRTSAPSLYVQLAKAGERAKGLARQAAARVERLVANAGRRRASSLPAAQLPQIPEAGVDDFEDIRVDGSRVAAPKVVAVAALEEPLIEEAPVAAKNALSLPLRRGAFDPGQMLILAGVVLLICGGLLLGGGLVLRAAGTASDRESPHVIAWLFEDPDRPLDERIVFTLSGTPAEFRINGLSITGQNNSDQPMIEVEGIIKPDVRRPDLKLAVGLVPEDDGGAAETQAAVPVGSNGIPAHAFFKLTFPFPPEAMDGQDGLTVEEFVESYGGLTLKLRYEVEGTEKAVIQYLPLEMLKSQLAEVKSELDGS